MTSLEERRSPLDGEIPILHVGANEDAPGLLLFLLTRKHASNWLQNAEIN